MEAPPVKGSSSIRTAPYLHNTSSPLYTYTAKERHRSHDSGRSISSRLQHQEDPGSVTGSGEHLGADTPFSLYSHFAFAQPATTDNRSLAQLPPDECPSCSYIPLYSDTPSPPVPVPSAWAMPSTYPPARTKDRHADSHHHHHHPPRPAPRIVAYPSEQSPSSSTPSSRYLSPIQEARIRSWRDHTDPNEAPLPPHPHGSGKNGIKSAPATLALRSSTSGGEQSSSHKGSTPTRSSSSRNPVPAPPRPTHHHSAHSHGHMRSYYSSKRKNSAATYSTSVTPAPTSPTPMSPMPQRSMSMTPEQMAFYAQQQPPTTQPQQIMGPEETAQIPPPILARPPNLPRIAGARDPISQNYWRERFPPVGGPMGINNGVSFTPVMMPGLQPGAYPPQAFGMGMGPYGF